MKVGTILLTKDGRKIGNAIVTHVFGIGPLAPYRIRTDFGNTAVLTGVEIDTLFYVTEEGQDPAARLADQRNLFQAFEVLHS